MKKIYFSALFLTQLAINAQIVNIPDPNFKALLLAASPTVQIAKTNPLSNTYVKIDTNNDGEIQVSEAEAIKSLNIFNTRAAYYTQYNSLASLEGISAFRNVESLILGQFPSLTTANFNNLTQLRLLSLTDCQNLTSINLSGSNAINNLDIKNNNLSTIDISNLTLLTNLNISENQFTSINLSNNPAISILNVSQNNLTSLNVSHLQNLIRILAISNNLSQLNFSNLTNLENITASDNGLSSITLTNTPKLNYLELSYNNLTTLDVTQSPLLDYLRVINNQLTQIDLSNAPKLETLMLSNNLLTSLDLSNNRLLGNYSANDNNLQTLNIKNGRNFAGNFSNNPNLNYICCDDTEMSTVRNLISTYGYNTEVNTYCSFSPGGIYYNITGTTRYDSNNNGCDSSDPYKSHQKFSITNGNNTGTYIARNDGNYNISTLQGNTMVTPILENPTYFTVSPSSFTANFPTQTSPLNQNFCLTANGTYNDLEIAIIPTTLAVPGFDATYKIVYKNKGTTAQSGTLSLNYNDNLMNYLAASTAPSSQAFGVLNWNFSNLQPFESRETTISFNLNTPTQNPALSGGDILNFTSQINGATDETPLDNVFMLNQTVVNSFDPNDKTCLQGTSIAQSQVGEYVHYLIRFENTGTANARNIVVTDEIDLSKFDINSIQPINGSHAFVTNIKNNNLVEFVFENIQLPFDDANNDGYVAFKIKTKSNLNIGDSFSNGAKIYFDYNHPIITNTYTTRVETVLATQETIKDSKDFVIYPNPVSDVLSIQSKKEVVKAQVYDMNGRIILSTPVKDNKMKVQELSKGNYILKIFTKDSNHQTKFIKN